MSVLKNNAHRSIAKIVAHTDMQVGKDIYTRMKDNKKNIVIALRKSFAYYAMQRTVQQTFYNYLSEKEQRNVKIVLRENFARCNKGFSKHIDIQNYLSEKGHVKDKEPESKEAGDSIHSHGPVGDDDKDGGSH